MIVAMWAFLVTIIGALLACVATVPPLEIDYAARKFQTDVQQQNLQTILISLENRLRNLDTIYSMQYSPSIEGKMERFARKLESLDTKIFRLETLISLQLDKISENISTKNFKDDITKTSWMRKIDAIYEGLYNRLTYMEGKFENNFARLNEKMESIIVQVNKMEDTLSTRDADIEAGLSDTTTFIEDVKNSLTSMESAVTGACKEHVNKTLGITEKTTKDATRLLKRGLEEINKTVSLKAQDIKETIDFHKNISYGTDELLKRMKSELKDDTNEYANKVADMYNDMWKTNEKLQNVLDKIYLALNHTKIENQNGLRTLMLQLGKILPKESISNNIPLDGQNVDELSRKLDTNFARILLKQDLFLESCHKLQMDESQLETKISDILEKLITIFEEKTTLQPHDLKAVEQLLTLHENSSKRGLQNVKNNILRLAQKLTNCKQELLGDLENDMQEVKEQLSLLASVMNANIFASNDYNVKSATDESNENLSIQLLPLPINDTEYTADNADADSNTNEYHYYIANNNETIMMNNNCTQNMQNCSREMFETNEVPIRNGDTNNGNEIEYVTETIDSDNESKPKMITLLDFSNYLVPNEEESDTVD